MLHLLKIFFFSQDFKILLRAHLALTIFSGLVMHCCVFVFELLELYFNLFLLINLSGMLLLKFLILFLEGIELIKMLLGLLLEILNLCVFLFNLHLQTLLSLLQFFYFILQALNLSLKWFVVLLKVLRFRLFIGGHLRYLHWCIRQTNFEIETL